MHSISLSTLCFALSVSILVLGGEGSIHITPKIVDQEENIQSLQIEKKLKQIQRKNKNKVKIQKAKGKTKTKKTKNKKTKKSKVQVQNTYHHFSRHFRQIMSHLVLAHLSATVSLVLLRASGVWNHALVIQKLSVREEKGAIHEKNVQIRLVNSHLPLVQA